MNDEALGWLAVSVYTLLVLVFGFCLGKLA